MLKAVRTGSVWLLAVALALFVDPLLWAFRRAMSATRIRMPAPPRLIRHSLHTNMKRCYSRVLAGGRGISVGQAVMAGLVLVGTALLLNFANVGSHALLAFPALAVPDTAIAKQLRTTVDKMTAMAKEYAGKAMPKEKHEEFIGLAGEAEDLKSRMDVEQKTAEMDRWLKAIPDPILPPTPEEKSKDDELAGYVSLGNMAGMSEGLQKFKAAGMPKANIELLEVNRVVMLEGSRTPHVAVTKKEWARMLERKAVPDAAVLILPDRRPGIIRAVPDTRLRISDVLAQGRTTSNSVEWLIESSFTNAAAEVADNLSGGSIKPESALVYTEASMPVRTVAHWMPVFNQQLEDIPQLQSLIENRLLYGLEKRKERQLVWGDGIAPNLKGLMEYDIHSIADDARYDAVNHQLIDIVRLGITDVVVAGYEPNAVLMHPYDWESALLLKDDEHRYIWVVVTDENGSRLWGLRVVETMGVAAQDGDPIERRVVIVGDFLRGAQETTRTDAAISVGWQDKQFVQNKRTILAETRLVLEVYAPAAFAYFETQAAALS